MTLLLFQKPASNEPEPKDHFLSHIFSPQAEFLLGKSSYSDDAFGPAAERFEVAVDEYFKADKECRALCEGAYNYDGYNYMEYSADLFQTVTGDRLRPCIGAGAVNMKVNQ